MINLIRTFLWKLQLTVQRDLVKGSPELKECFRLLCLTSRSFAALIQGLHPELRTPVCLLYLTLRGLDTIEDDMTIDIKEKEPLLRNFHDIIDDENWTYNGNGPGEKHRELLVKFDVVAKELKNIEEGYEVIIKDITKRMGEGMADYATDAENNLRTIRDYEIYCHYAAGLVGEGLTRMFVEAKMVDPVLLKKPELMESMGQVLQQTNIIRDVREDHEEKRYFWPKEVWSKYVDKFSNIFLPENKEKALQCQSEMILLALQHVKKILPYFTEVKEQSVFNFVAIPQTMALATLELCFQNDTMFERNIKISRVDTCDLMMRSQNLQSVSKVFREYARRIRRKNQPQDPCFLDILNACNEIENCIESEFPTQKILPLRKTLEGHVQPQHSKGDSTWCTLFFQYLMIFALVYIGGLVMPSFLYSFSVPKPK